MKSMLCEMCGNNDLVKQDGYFVCQYCGTKYTVEEAKKLMVEGTVKIDNSDFVEKYLQNARRAKKKEDWKETEKYYNLVEQNEPTNIEAIFYSAFAQVKSALLEAETRAKREATFNILSKSVSVIDDNYDNTNEEHQKLLFEIMDDIKGLEDGVIVPTTHLQEYVTKNGYGNIVDRSQLVENDSVFVTECMINKVVVAYMESLANIIVAYSPEQAKKLFVENVNVLSTDSEIHEKVAPYIDGYKTPEQACVEIVNQVKMDNETTSDELDAQIDALGKTICPMFMVGERLDFYLKYLVREELQKTHTYAKAFVTGGCYVATAVYGSYDCPEVWTLRRFRDFTLAKSVFGRLFIRTYYAVSPTLVKWFGETKWFKNLWKPTLDKMVARLNKKGVENTPYDDIVW